MIAEIKCGKCKIVFPIRKDGYMERLGQIENIHNKRIICPSCWTEMPFGLKRVFDEFIFNNGKHEDWEIGMRFQSNENRD